MKRRKAMNHARRGFTLVEIMMVITLIGLLAALAIPSFVNARTKSRINSCINNLRQLNSAKDQWAMENAKMETDTVALSDVAPFIKGGVPTCPASGTYEFTVVRTGATCTVTGHVL